MNNQETVAFVCVIHVYNECLFKRLVQNSPTVFKLKNWLETFFHYKLIKMLLVWGELNLLLLVLDPLGTAVLPARMS